MDTKFAITKLNNENYFNWQLKVEMLMRERDIWKAVSDAAPNPVTDAWTKMDEKARATIILLVEDDQLQHVRDADSAAKAWKNLKEFYQKNSAGNRVFLLRSIMRQRASDSDDIEKHVKSMTDLFQRLSAIGKEIKPDFFMAATLMGSLPDSYDNLITAMEARDEEELTPSYICSKIIDEYKRRSSRESAQRDDMSTAAYSANTYRKNKKYCTFCKRPGHIIEECRNKAKKEKAVTEQNMMAALAEVDTHTEFAFATYAHTYDPSSWIVDSGSTSHISGTRDHFILFDSSYRATIELANGKRMNAIGKGDIIVQFINGSNESRNVRVCDVLYVPGIIGNLLSVMRMIDKGAVVRFNDKQCHIRQGETELAVGDIQGQLFIMRTAKPARTKHIAHPIQNRLKKNIAPSAKQQSTTEEVEFAFSFDQTEVHAAAAPAANPMNNHIDTPKEKATAAKIDTSFVIIKTEPVTAASANALMNTQNQIDTVSQNASDAENRSGEGDTSDISVQNKSNAGVLGKIGQLGSWLITNTRPDESSSHQSEQIDLLNLSLSNLHNVSDSLDDDEKQPYDQQSTQENEEKIQLRRSTRDRNVTNRYSSINID